MKAKFSDVVIGQCYKPGRGKIRKKVDDNKYVVMKGKKARTHVQRGDPSVRITGCTLSLLGEGLPKLTGVIEMGRKKRRK